MENLTPFGLCLGRTDTILSFSILVSLLNNQDSVFIIFLIFIVVVYYQSFKKYLHKNNRNAAVQL